MTRSRHDPLDPSAAHEHAQFARRLARQLVRDEALADDLAQDAWLSAMRQPPDDGRAWRAWLRTVVRRAARFTHRGEMRRLRREQATAERRGSTSASTLDVVAETERIRRLAASVAELGEKNRDVVFLRYYEGLPPRDIARRLGISVDATKARLKRSLAELRAKLDAEHGGDRSAWCVAFASWLVPGVDTMATTGAAAVAGAGVTPGSIGKGVVLMSAKTKLAGGIACCVLIITAGLWLAGRLGSEPDADPQVASSSAPSTVAPPSSDDNGHLPPLTQEDRNRLAEKAATIRELKDPMVDRHGFPYLTFHGRVVDRDRRPVEGAWVQLVDPRMATGDRPAVRTDGAGSFRLQAVRVAKHFANAEVLRILDEGSGAVAALPIEIGKDEPLIFRIDHDDVAAERHEVEVGTIVLEPVHDLEVLVLDGAIPIGGASIEVATGLDREWLAAGVSDAGGRAHFRAPEGVVAVTARTPTHAGRAVRLHGASTHEPLAVALEPHRALEVEVVEKESGAPIEGVTVETFERPQLASGHFCMDRRPYVPASVAPVDTDAEGRARITGVVPGAHLGLEATREGCVMSKVLEGYSPRIRVGPHEEAVRIEMTMLSTRRVRIPVKPSAAVPDPTATLRLERKVTGSRTRPPVPATARMHLGELIIDGLPSRDFSAIAVTRGGDRAFVGVPACSDEGHETEFLARREITVTVVDAFGERVPFVPVAATSRLVSSYDTRSQTGADGVTILHGVVAETTTVVAKFPGAAGWQRAARVELADSDTAITITAPTPSSLVLRLIADGEPRLPERYRILVDDSGEALVQSESPDTGHCTISVLRPLEELDPIELSVFADGFAGTTLEVDANAFDSASPVDVVLERPAAIVATVPRSIETSILLDVQRWQEERGVWSAARSKPFETSWPQADGTFRFENLDPGRYRVRERRSGMVTDPVEITGPGDVAYVRLDLADTVRIAGRVLAPASTDFDDVRVQVRDVGTPWPNGNPGIDYDEKAGMPPGIRVTSDGPDGPSGESIGRFSFELPASRVVEIRAWHPALEAVGKPVRIVQGVPAETDLTLRRGPVVRIPVPSDIQDRNHIRVVATVESSLGRERRDTIALVANGFAEVGGLTSGTWSLWIDPLERYAPLRLDDVMIADADVVVDSPPFTRGTTVRISVHAAGEIPIPAMWACGRSVDGFSYWREIRSQPGEAVLQVEGFGAGRIRFGVVPQTGRSDARGYDLDLDGETDQLIEFEFEDPLR